MTESPQGLLLLDKPSGVTSFDCVHIVRRRLGVERVGHCGTLDPDARGVLLILVGRATRRQDSFLALEKEYWFRSELGYKTSTGDLEGQVTETKAPDHLTRLALEEKLKTFLGTIAQIPPLYSALKYKGKPYYAYARKGQDVPRPARDVSIKSFSLTSFCPPFWEARVVCSRGTYIRTLIEDVAERLGTCATLVELVRTRVGSYRQEQALSWQELRTMKPEDLIQFLRPVAQEQVLSHA